MRAPKLLLAFDGITDFSPPWNEGAKNSAFGWLQMMTSKGVEVHVISSKSWDHPGIAVNHDPTLARRDGPAQRWLSAWRLGALCARLCQWHNFDAIAICAETWRVVPLLRPLTGLPCRKLIWQFGEHRLSSSLGYTSLGRTLDRWVYRQLDGAIVISERLRKMVSTFECDQWTQKVYHVPPVPVDLSKWLLADDDQLRHNFDWSRADFVITHLGAPTVSRGLSDVLNAIPIAQQKVPMRLMLAIASNNHCDDDRFIGYAKRSGIADRVRFYHTVNAKDFLAAGNLYVYPRRDQWRTFHRPLSVIEALLVGCPVLCSDLPSYRELIRDGRTGLMCPTGDVKAFAEKIVFAATQTNDIKIIAHRGRKAITDLYQQDIGQILYNAHFPSHS